MNTNKNILGVQAYLFFDGRCEEAIEFYKKALDAEVLRLLRFKDGPPAGEQGCSGPPAPGDKIMHASIRIGKTDVMVSDGRCEGKPNFQGFSLTVSVPDEATADKYFNAVAEGGKVIMPLAKTFFSERFGMAQDRFGVMWMVIIAKD